MPPDPPFILPLYQLFEQLCTYERRQLKHHTLSPQNYLELVEVLVRGYALVSPEDLYRLCKLLWFKPHFSESKFRALFDAHLAPYQIAEWRTPPPPPPAPPYHLSTKFFFLILGLSLFFTFLPFSTLFRSPPFAEF